MEDAPASVEDAPASVDDASTSVEDAPALLAPEGQAILAQRFSAGSAAMTEQVP